MPRIRSIKPEFWTSEQVLECSRDARLLFIGLWNFCDDAGRHPYSVRQIKAEVFPADGLSDEIVLGMLQELSKNGLISLYESAGKEFLYVTGWKHQRIDKPQEPKYPDPFSDHSKNIPGTFPPDRIGKDRIGEEDAAPGGAQFLEKDLFARGKQVLGNNAGGMIAKLLKAKGSVELARSAIEMAATKENPREYIGAAMASAAVNGKPNGVHARGILPVPHAAANKPMPGDTSVFIQQGTPEWEAWQTYRVSQGLKPTPVVNFGWRFPSLTPPSP